MQTTSISNRTKITSLTAAFALLGLGAIAVQGQSVLYDFFDGNADGWANAGFGNSPSPSIATFGGLNYMYIPLGGFQVANVSSDNLFNGPTLAATMAAAAANPADYNLSYDYYIDTAAFSGSTFLQVGTFVNTGSGYYGQDFNPNVFHLTATQLASGQVFAGQVTENLAAVGFNMPTAESFYRLGLIENGNGSDVGVYYRNISLAPTPEPASLSLFGLSLAAGAVFLRRRKA